MARQYPRGSEWREWDLHIHTPSTKLNSNYVGSTPDEKWDKFIDALENSKIKIIGATNYFCIDGYQKLLSYKNSGRLQNINTILPNIEFRISDRNKDGEFINFHVLFSPDVELRKIEDFLTRLAITTTSSAGTGKFCNASDLTEVGYDNVTVAFNELQAKLNESFTRIREYLVIGVCRGFGSFRPEANGGRAATLAVEMDKFSDLVFGRGDDTAFYLDVNRFPSAKRKPVIVSSDSHSLNDICSKFTWIKADPTYEGLKQTLYEPEDRVYIGETPPLKIERDKVIVSLSIAGSNGWFNESSPIVFNENMTSVIGGKGTGKTALLDLIALSSGKTTMDEKSFIKKASSQLLGTKLKLLMGNGSISEVVIGEQNISNQKEKTMYLSQSFVEKLCSVEEADKLRSQIESVIFQKVPREDKAQHLDFNDYKESIIKIIADKKNMLSGNIRKINEHIFHLKQVITRKTETEKAITETIKNDETYREELVKLKQTITEAGVADTVNLLTDINDKISSQEEEISKAKGVILNIENAKETLSNANDNVIALTTGLRECLTSVGADKSEIESVNIQIRPDNIKDIIETKAVTINKLIQAKTEELTKLKLQADGLNKALKLEKSKHDNIKKINEHINANKKYLISLNEELEKIKVAEEALPSQRAERDKMYVKFFEHLYEEKNRLAEIYKPLVESLKASEQRDEKLFEFTVIFEFDIKSFSEDGDEFINHKKKGRFHNKASDVLTELINEHKFNLDVSSLSISDKSVANIKSFVKNIENLFIEDDDGNSLDIGSQLKDKYTDNDFYDWLYATKYFSIKYSIKFNGVELGNLSPGLKGVALLILFLELDTEDLRPILIDQPEENLDNRSVYETLVNYFRKTKERRQVIIVTHNPNLVVNTDSEQIIVTNFDKEHREQLSTIYYSSGSLEDTCSENPLEPILLERKGIREHICHVLEGGAEAFTKREEKYGFNYNLK